MDFFKNDWDYILDEEMQKDYFKNLIYYIKKEYAQKEIYPLKKHIFRVFKSISYQKIKVVILGQDPYHTPNTAMGFSFSVNEGCKLPPSLLNIFKELNSDLNIPPSSSGDLTKWVEQGVFLLNATLTVERGKPNSHKDIGWTIFTDRVISILNEREQPIVFILWGNMAKQKINLITNKQHLILASAHPSPFSAEKGFFGSKPFSKTNAFLGEQNKINWYL